MKFNGRKNPWHVVFDRFRDAHPNLSSEIKALHPTIVYPIIAIELNDGTTMFYHGRTSTSKVIDPDDYDREFFNFYVNK